MDENYAVIRQEKVLFVHFNSTGHLESYALNGSCFCYEIPCYTLTHLKSVVSHEPNRWCHDKRTCFPTVSECYDFNKFLCDGANIHNTLDSDFYFEGYQQPHFCYRKAYTDYFPGLINPPNEFKNSKIRPSKFYVSTPQGLEFKSPTWAAFLRFRQQNSPHIDDGTDSDDYEYEYWNQI